MGTHPIFESDFDCLTERKNAKEKDRTKEKGRKDGRKTERHQVF